MFDQLPQSKDIMDGHEGLIMPVCHDHFPRAVGESGHDELPKSWEPTTHGTFLIQTYFVDVDEEVLKNSCALW
jgi:hypothetical protein